jgi:hypothetical protein
MNANTSKSVKITRQNVDNWLARNAAHIGTYVANGNKGTYDKRVGQAASFETRGKTWKDVLLSLGADLNGLDLLDTIGE